MQIARILAAVAILTGCGGSGGGDGSTTSGSGGAVGARPPVGLVTGRSIAVLGENRGYILFVPQVHVNAPVLLLFHGHSSNNSELLGLDGQTAPFKVWLDIAERERLVLVVPNGRFASENDKGWNDCRSDAPTNSTADDVEFVRLLLDAVASEYGTDPRRVYASGISNGGHMAIRLAFELPERLAAFASIAASNPVNSKCFDLYSPVSALLMNGTADPLLPFEGGAMAGNRGAVLSADAALQYWVTRNRTEVVPQVVDLVDIDVTDNSRVQRQLYRNGASGTEVALFKVVGGGHMAPSIRERYSGAVLSFLGNQNADIEMAEEVWKFLRNKTR